MPALTLEDVFSSSDPNVRLHRAIVLDLGIVRELAQSETVDEPMPVVTDRVALATWLLPRIETLGIEELSEILRYSGQAIRVLVIRGSVNSGAPRMYENSQKVLQAIFDLDHETLER